MKKIRPNLYPERLRGVELNVSNFDFVEDCARDLAQVVRDLIAVLQRFLEKLLGWPAHPEPLEY